MSTSPTGARAPELQHRLGQVMASGLAAGLAFFHAALLWDRILSFSLLDPAVALRWGAAGLLLVSLVLLRRAGVSLVRGREAMVVWTLVALLHAGIPAAGGHAAMLTEAEVGHWLALTVALSTTLACFTGAAGVARPAPPRTAGRLDSPSRRRLLRAGYLEILFARPPPAV